jgi:hypothetical protein
MPAPRALRALLLEAVRGVDGAVLEGLGPLGSFRALAALWATGWLGERKPTARATSAAIRHRLREIGAARRSLAQAALLPAGAVVLIEGRVVALSPLDLDDDGGEMVRVPPPPVRWIDSRAPRQGDRVTLLGFVDRALDPSLPPRGPRQSPTRLLVRPALLPLVGQVTAAGKPRSRTIP